MTLLSKWMSLSLRAKGFVVSTLSAAAMLVAAWVTYSLVISATEAEAWVNHALQAGEEIQKMKASLTDASLRYGLTGLPGTKRLQRVFARTWRSSIAPCRG